MRKGFRKFRRVCSLVLPALLTTAGATVLLFAMGGLWIDHEALVLDQRLLHSLSRGSITEDLNGKVDLLSKRADDARSLMGNLIAIAGFVVLAQGLFVYFNVQNYTKQADASVQALEKIREKAEKTQEQAQAKLELLQQKAEDAQKQAQARLELLQQKEPILIQIPQLIREAVKKLSSLFQDPDGLVDLYEKIDKVDRQRIVHYEKSVAGYESIEEPQLRASLASVYRGLSVFYASKYRSALLSAKATKPLAQDSPHDDLDRARMYAELARPHNPGVFCIENDLGWMASFEGDFEEAENRFRASLALNSRQQRAGTNLGIVLLTQKHYAEAIAVLRKALLEESWESSKTTLKSRPHYNLACGLCKVAESDPVNAMELLGEACDHLESAARYDLGGLQGAFKADITERGDLYLLQTTGVFSQRMASLAKTYGL